MSDSSPSLVGKILSLRSFFLNIVQPILKATWSAISEFLVEEEDTNLFLFHFVSESDRDMVLKMGPCNIRSQFLVLKPWEPEMTFSEVEFQSIPFWVQVHGMPRNRMREVNAKFIGLKLGKLLEIDSTDYADVAKRPFLRLHVELDLSKPLVAGFAIPRRHFPALWGPV